MFRAALIALVVWIASWNDRANACVISSPPIEATDVSAVLNAADSIEVAQLICDDCSDEQFTHLKFRSLDHQKLWRTAGYIIDLPRNALDENPDVFDPWKIWGMSQEGCNLVPAVRPEGLYDVAIKNDQIIWVARHDAYMAKHFEETSRDRVLSSEYLSKLAMDVYQNADIYWSCDAPINGRASISDADFNSYGVPLKASMAPIASLNCLNGVSARGIIHLHEDGYIDTQWTLVEERLGGERLGNDEAHESFSRHLIELLKQ